MYDKEHKKSYTRAAIALGSLIGVVAVIVETIVVRLVANFSEGAILKLIFAVLGFLAFLIIYYVGIYFGSKWMIKKDDELTKGK